MYLKVVKTATFGSKVDFLIFIVTIDVLPVLEYYKNLFYLSCITYEL